MSYILKLIKRAVTAKIHEHFSANCILSVYQSAYRLNHSTETAPLCICEDLLAEANRGDGAVFFLLDLSAAFNTDHKILKQRLSSHFGVPVFHFNCFFFLPWRPFPLCCCESDSGTYFGGFLGLRPCPTPLPRLCESALVLEGINLNRVNSHMKLSSRLAFNTFPLHRSSFQQWARCLIVRCVGLLQINWSLWRRVRTSLHIDSKPIQADWKVASSCWRRPGSTFYRGEEPWSDPRKQFDHDSSHQ